MIGFKARDTNEKQNATRLKISEAKIRQIARLLAVGLDVLQIAQISGVNQNTINRYLAAFRERIAHFCEAESPVKQEKLRLRKLLRRCRFRGLRGRGARGKTIVLGCSNEMVESAQRLSLTAQRARSRAYIFVAG